MYICLSDKILSGWARKIIMDKYLMFIENIAAACSFNVSISKPGLQVSNTKQAIIITFFKVDVHLYLYKYLFC